MRIEPFLSIVVSQAIFRLQNSNKTIKSLDTLKYLSGYWGFPKESIKGEFKAFLDHSKLLKNKNNIFQPIHNSNLKLIQIIDSNNENKKKRFNEYEKLLFQLSPEETEYYFNELPEKIQSVDFSKRENLAILIKMIFETQREKPIQIATKQQNIPFENQNEFRWRYLSRLFQMGKF